MLWITHSHNDDIFCLFLYRRLCRANDHSPAPKDTCWEGTGLAGISKKAFNTVFFMV